MGTGICLFLVWEKGIWVTETGNKSHRNGMVNTSAIIKTVTVIVCHILSSVVALPPPPPPPPLQDPLLAKVFGKRDCIGLLSGFIIDIVQVLVLGNRSQSHSHVKFFACFQDKWKLLPAFLKVRQV